MHMRVAEIAKQQRLIRILLHKKNIQWIIKNSLNEFYYKCNNI